MKLIKRESSEESDSNFQPLGRTTLRTNASPLRATFWLAIVLVAIGASVVLALWQAPIG